MRDAVCKECCPYGCDAHFEEAVRDSERLEWLVQSKREIWEFDSGWCVDDGGGHFKTTGHKYWRDAIDEAMEEAL